MKDNGTLQLFVLLLAGIAGFWFAGWVAVVAALFVFWALFVA